MNRPPQVSVVVPCYNAERYIAATLRSVAQQQAEVPLEIIVVDDGSTDGSALLVEREFPEVRLIRQANGGVATARNTGIAAAQAPWIAFCDADDLWLHGKLAKQWQALANEPNCRMCYTAWAVWTSPDVSPAKDEIVALTDTAQDWRGASGWVYADLLLDCVVWTSTVLAHRSVFDDVGVFNPSLRIGEDYDLWLRASRVTPIKRVDQPLALYRQHSGNITRGAPRDNYKAKVIQSALDTWGFDGPDGRTADRGEVRASLAKSWSDFAYSQLANGLRAQARSSLIAALKLSPLHAPAWKLLFRACFMPDRMT